MLWVDKYRPNTFNKIDYHRELTRRLLNLAKRTEFPHLLVYGPAGAGKKTRIMLILKEIFGAGVEKTRVEHKTFTKPTGNDKIEITTLASAHHIEITPSDAGYHDRLVVQEVIKEIAQSRPLDASTFAFKVVVLNDVEKLSHGAQHALRRTMEKYMGTCRIILCSTSLCQVIDPLRSRCLCVRVAAPSADDIVKVLNFVAKKENFDLPAQVATNIAKSSERNMRRAILQLEALHVQAYPFPDNAEPQIPDWEKYLDSIANDVVQAQHPGVLQMCRTKLYELLGHCIPASLIFKCLLIAILKRIDESLSDRVTLLAAHYEHQMQLGSKEIFHIEAFLAKFMSVYYNYLLQSFGG